ncbi:hypothetical protein ACLOJK_038687 [Asimina triloba]
MPSESSSADRRPTRPQPAPTAVENQPEQSLLPCPRCESTQTKFCYYNNYNLSQPRHFCKSCRRYWTQGGALRNIPVGGGTRSSGSKAANHHHHPNKRSRTSDTSAAAAPRSASSAVSSVAAVPISSFERDVSAQLDIGGVLPGSFSSLLATSSPGFLALGEPFLNRTGYGLGGIGLGLGRGLWPAGEVGDGGANTWQSGIGDGMVDGDCFSWPDLAISTPGTGLQ